MTPIHYLRPDEDGDPARLEVSPDRLTIWLPVELAEGLDPEWDTARVSRHEDDLDDEGYVTPERIAALRAGRTLEASRRGQRSVDLDVSRVVRDVEWQARAEARGMRRWGHPSLSDAERG